MKRVDKILEKMLIVKGISLLSNVDDSVCFLFTDTEELIFRAIEMPISDCHASILNDTNLLKLDLVWN